MDQQVNALIVFFGQDVGQDALSVTGHHIFKARQRTVGYVGNK
jgi:hypothetical protein